MHRIIPLTMKEFIAARAWAMRNPYKNPFKLHRKAAWCFVAAAQQIRMETFSF